jgi:hypothetical protein
VQSIASVLSVNEDMQCIADEENLMSSLLSLFPKPRRELGEITPNSVILTPEIQPSSLLVGNAARCILHYANFEKFIILISNGVKILKSDCIAGSTIIGENRFTNDGIERLICSMATCTDIRVRKNIAIVLAKCSRINHIKEKVVKFRGMQMIMQLQDQLNLK